MKVTSSPHHSTVPPAPGATHAPTSATSRQVRPPAANEGPLSPLKARSSAPRDSAPPLRAALPGSTPSFGARHHSTSRHGSSHSHSAHHSHHSQSAHNARASHHSQYPSHAQPSSQATHTPFHAGTRNDCSLHTIAAMTGWSEQQVVQSLGLTQQQVQHISTHGMQPQEFTAALNHLNGGNVHHRQGSPRSFAASLPQLQDGGQFALGMERNAGIGHLVSARRAGNQLVVTDRQSGQQMVFNSQQDLQNYLNQSGASRIHTWYNQ